MAERTISTTKVAYHGGTADNNSAYVGTSYNGNSQEVCTTRFAFMSDGTGAKKIWFQTGKALCDVAGAGDQSYDSIAEIRFAVTTSATQYKTYKGNAGYGCPANLVYDATGNGYIRGTLNINLLPNTQYYLWIFPGSSYAGWTRHQLSSVTLKIDGVYGTASTITASDGNFGSAIPVSVSNLVSGVTDVLTVTCAGNTETITLTDGSGTWTPSLATYGALITNAKTATAIFTVSTSYGGTSWGTNTKAITVTFPEATCKPTIGGVTIAPDNTGTPASSFTVLVKGYSKAKATITATGQYSATIADYSMTVNGGTVHGASSVQTSGTLNASGTLTATITVTDSRGYTATATEDITVQDYYLPVLQSVTVFRCNALGVAADDGTYLSAKAVANIASVSGQNSLTLSVAATQVGGTYATLGSLTNNVASVFNANLDPDKTYNVKVTLNDVITSDASVDPVESVKMISAQNWGIKFTVASSKVSACGIGKAPESANVLELPSTWGIKRGLARALFSDDFVDFIYPVGSIYISTASTNPGTLFGGTWQRIEDTFLLASGTSYAAGSTGGEASHTLTVEEIPGHTHTVPYNLEAWRGSGGNIRNPVTNGSDGNVTSGSTGGGQAHNNMPPYLAVYVWERTA